MGRTGVGLGVAVVAFVLMAAPAAARKPDLVVKSAAMSDPEGAYVFHGSNPQVAFRARTANVGHAVARSSSTAFLLSPHRADPWTDAIVAGFADVPRLRPGTADVGRYHGRLNASSSIPGYGRYYVIACADGETRVAESDETNNCRYTGRTLDVIAHGFKGTVSGNSPMGYGSGVKESWGGDLTFDFVPKLSSPGYYRYQPQGTLTYKVSGTDGVCTYRGSGTHDVGTQDSLTLSYSAEIYGGNGGNFAPFFTYTQTCPNPYGGTYTTHVQEGTEAAWWVTGNESLFFDVRPFKLLDSYDSQGVHWTWNLNPVG
jgi:hypothetical protein